MSQSRKWKDAWPGLADSVRPESLEKFGPFPSLYVNDYLHTLEARGVDGETIKFIKDLVRELNWAYENWGRSCLTPADFVKSMVASVSFESSPGAELIAKFLGDYCASHNIPNPLSGTREDEPEWARPVAEGAGAGSVV